MLLSLHLFVKVRVLAVVGVLVCAVQLVRSQASPADATPNQQPNQQHSQTSQVQHQSRH